MNNCWSVWFTGLHGAGKTTIATNLSDILKRNGVPFVLLDGDEIRKIISSELGYSLEGRNEHMRRIADLCRIISKDGVLSIACVASPTESSRDYAKKSLKKFLLVYVKCSLKTCEERDVKGHYKKARNREEGFEDFLGVSLKYEEPKNPDLVLNTDKESIAESVNKLVEKLKEMGVINF